MAITDMPPMVVYGCCGCERIGRSERDLLAQGCEGHPEPFIPLAYHNRMLAEHHLEALKLFTEVKVGD